MAIEEVRAAGYDAELAFAGYTAEDGTVVPDVYGVTGTAPPTEWPPAIDSPPPFPPSAGFGYVADTPAAVAAFLELERGKARSA